MRRVTMLLAAALVVGCEDDIVGTIPPEPPEPVGIQTSAGSYQVLPWDFSVPEGYEVAIPYTFTNRSASPVYLVGCRPDFAPQVERWEGTKWVNTRFHLPDLCGGVVEVAPFGTFSQDLVVYGVKPEFSDRPSPSSTRSLGATGSG